MTDTTTISRRSNPIAVMAGLLTCLLSGLALYGFATGNLQLVRFWGAVPMRLFVAVALFLSGAAVLLLASGWKRTAGGVAVAVGLLGLELLRQAIFGVLITGIEAAAFASGGAARVTSRVTTLIASCLLLVAFTLLFMSGVVRIRRRLAVVGVLGSILGSIGAVAFLSYAVGMGSAFRTGHLTALAVHTALCLALLGLAAIRFAWADSAAGERGAPAWLPALVGIGVMSVTVCLWEVTVAEQRAGFQRTIDFDSRYLKDDLEVQIDNRIQPLVRLARRRESVADVSQQEWDSDVQSILTRGGYQAIQWVDASLRAIWITPPGAGDLLPDGSAAFEERRKAAFDQARQTRTVALTRPVDLVTGGKGMLVCVPVLAGDELKGYVTGVFRYNLLLKTVLTSAVTSRYSVTLFDGREQVYAWGPKSSGPEWARTLGLNVPGGTWKLHISPGESLLAETKSPMEGALLIVGWGLALLLALFVRLLLGAPRSRTAALLAGNAVGEHDEGQPALSDISKMPVISYARDGAPQVWNPAAKDLFGGPPPRVSAAAEPFRAVRVALLRASSTNGDVKALQMLLESCSLPALAFDADGAFSIVNTTAAHVLGWTPEVWRERRASGPFVPGDSTSITFVLILQGQVAASRESETATGSNAPAQSVLSIR